MRLYQCNIEFSNWVNNKGHSFIFHIHPHTVLTSIQLLLAEANPDDGLMADISHEYKYNRPKFLENAKQWVKKYAKEDVIKIGTKRSSQVDTEDAVEEKNSKITKIDNS